MGPPTLFPKGAPAGPPQPSSRPDRGSGMAIDLEAYFRRIGYAGPRAPTLETLCALNRLHPQAIAFENLDPLMGRPVALDDVALQRKLVTGGRGGYCYEHGLVFGGALEALGFEVSGLAGRVIKDPPPRGARPRTHMLLRVTIGGADFVVDVGFGIATLTAPLRLEVDIAQETPHETYRLIRAGDQFEMQVTIGGTWEGLYRFDLQKQNRADYEMRNHYTSNHPDSQFVTELMAARTEGGCRHTLRNDSYALRTPGGVSERRRLQTVAEMRAMLENEFRITLPEIGDLDPTLERILARARAVAP